MGGRRITKQQNFRIERIQAERIERAERREQRLQDAQLGPEQRGRIIAHFGVQLEVEALEGEHQGQRFRCHKRTNLQSLVTGDEVIWQPAEQASTGIISAVLPRRSVLVRPDAYHKLKPVAANIDRILLVIAPLPTPSAELIDRYLVACEATDIRPVLLLNKADLLAQAPNAAAMLKDFEALGYESRILSAHGDLGDLNELIGKQTVVFVGQSGVGKSSLINALLPDAQQQVNDISSNSKLGQHTTTTARWFDLPSGGALIDSPGIREFGVWHMDATTLLSGFIEFAPHIGRCRFRNCAHLNEPGCALQAEVAAGTIQARRLASFHRLCQEIAEQDSRR